MNHLLIIQTEPAGVRNVYTTNILDYKLRFQFSPIRAFGNKRTVPEEMSGQLLILFYFFSYTSFIATGSHLMIFF